MRSSLPCGCIVDVPHFGGPWSGQRQALLRATDTFIAAILDRMWPSVLHPGAMRDPHHDFLPLFDHRRKVGAADHRIAVSKAGKS